MKKNVVLFKSLPKDQEMRLAEAFNLTKIDGSSSEIIQANQDVIRQADGMIGVGMSTPVNDEFLSYAPNVKAFSTISVGFDNYNLADLKNRGIRLMNTPTVLTEATADLVFTLLMTTARRTVELANLVEQKQWKTNIVDNHYGTDVFGKTIGILGMGRIAKAIVKRAHCGFDMNVIYYNRSAHPDVEQKYNAVRCELDEVLKQADFVVVMLPLNAETDCLITKEKLALMKPSAFLINGARGRIIDEKALIEALQNGVIKGAGLDVFEVEPLPTDSPLIGMKNVVLSPHVGSATHETRYAMAVCAVDNLIAALQSNPPTENWVNPEVG